MDGVIPPEQAGLPPRAPALVAPGAGWTAPRTGGRRRRAAPGRRPLRGTAPSRIPAPLLAAAVALLDALAAAGAGLAVASLPVSGGRPTALLVAFAALLLLPSITALLGGYAHPVLFGMRRGPIAALTGLVASVVGLFLAGKVLGAHGALPSGVAMLWLVIGVPAIVAARLAGAAGLRWAADRVRHRAVVVGDPLLAAHLAAALAARPDRSLTLVGLVEDLPGAAPNPGAAGLPPAGGLDALVPMIRRGEVDQVVLALPWSAEARIARLLGLLREHPVEVRLAPDLAGYRARAGSAPPEAGHIHLPCLLGRPIGGVAGLLKAAEDQVLALVALAVLAVPMGLIALAIRLDSPGPVLFRQRRTGFNNRDFHVLKFRTMYHELADPDVIRQVTEGDPRVTRIGAILRRTSLDELPQVFNVLRGEMSFVGPRPHAPGTRAGGRLFEEVDARYAARHRVKPGLTGLAQVRDWRGPTETEEKLIRRVDSDLEYIERWSIWLDFAILVRTLLAVVRMRNAC